MRSQQHTHFLRILGKRFIDIDIFTLAASLSFYALFSLAPLLVLLLWITTLLYPDAQRSLVGQVDQIAGDSAADVAATVIQHARAQPTIGSLAGVWSTLLLFIGASAVFAQLQNALNQIFGYHSGRSEGILTWLRKRIFSIGVILALGFLLLISIVASTTLQLIFAYTPSILPTLGYLTTLALNTLAFTLFYRYLPERTILWRQSLLGGAITAMLFMAGRYGIGVYLARTAPGSAYGSMGSLVILVVWIYYASLVFLTGALVTAVIDERHHANRA